MNSPPSFSLLTQPWIPCVMVDGRNELLSIRDIFDGRHDVAVIRGDSPAQDYAVLRVLLAIYWRAHHAETHVSAGGTFIFSDWFGRTAENLGQPDDLVGNYLDDYADRFDLLHPQLPFMQVADLHTEKDTRLPVQRIVPEAEGHYFTMRAGRARESLDFAEAARWLIYTQAYDYSGIKSGAVGDERVKGGRGFPIGTGWTGRTGGTVVVGDNLRETLLLNTTLEALADVTDRPVWEREPDTAAERHIPPPTGAGESAMPQGPSDLATWQGRRIRLFTESGKVTEVLVTNGDRIPDAGANVLGDPMTPYRYSKNKSKKDLPVHYALPLDPNRTMWKSLEPLISLDRDPGFDGKNVAPQRPKNLSQLAVLAEKRVVRPVLNVQMVSVDYGPQDSSVATTVTSHLDIPLALLEPEAGDMRADVIDVASSTLQAAIALGQFAGNLLEAAGRLYEFQADPTDAILTELEPEFSRWLRSFEADRFEEQAGTWQKQLREIILERAAEMMRGAGPKALVGREISDGRDGANTKILSAGSAHRMLQARLKKMLTYIDDEEPDKETNR
ncbi:type I-E CRISPR-associated protein Cse1/CasA [Corynebacterium nasicanis]|uniref:Type I-E CRISPR-associated protein Cse1/CasA n=1 Tax=Corynebacterium nasicanis TaxID=1448267 RepID=A0ABW1QDJ6_9CORY